MKLVKIISINLLLIFLIYNLIIFLNYKDNIPIFVDTHHTSPNGNLIVASEILTNIEKFND